MTVDEYGERDRLEKENHRLRAENRLLKARGSMMLSVRRLF